MAALTASSSSLKLSKVGLEEMDEHDTCITADDDLEYFLFHVYSSAACSYVRKVLVRTEWRIMVYAWLCRGFGVESLRRER